MRDRFKELQALALQLHPAAAAQMHQGEGPPGAPFAAAAGAAAGAAAAANDTDIEQGLVGGPSNAEDSQSGGFLRDYFNKVNILTAAMKEIAEKIDLMQELKTKLIEATSPDEEKGKAYLHGFRV